MSYFIGMYILILFASVVMMFHTWYTNVFATAALYVEPGALELTVHSI